MQAYQALTERFEKIFHLSHLSSIASWDEAVNMPAGGGEARANALATLNAMMHELLVAPEVKDLLENAQQENLENDWQRANVTWMQKQYLRQSAVPSKLVSELTRAKMQSEQAWRRMRAENNWRDFAPLLEKTFNLVREQAVIQAEALGLEVYDALIDEYAPGFNQANITPIFDLLKQQLPQKIKHIVAAQKNNALIELHGHYPIEQQKQLGLELMQALGFDFNHGRLDVSHHPFCGGVPDDIRITSRYSDNEFVSSIMATCHETGHARYEQDLPKDWQAQPVGRALGIAVHESQSLLIEMYACRSPEFMQFLSPLIKRYFGDDPGFAPENLIKLYTRVKPGFIRVDADGVTYPLHVILRYEIEQQLFKGQIDITDLPEVWHSYMQQFFQLSTKGNDKDGVMQDVHWPAGIFGYFPSYTLGTLIAAQLFQTMLQANPGIPAEIAQGNFSTLFTWLQQHIHSRASSVDVDTLLRDATGETLNPDYFLQSVDRLLD